MFQKIIEDCNLFWLYDTKCTSTTFRCHAFVSATFGDGCFLP